MVNDRTERGLQARTCSHCYGSDSRIDGCMFHLMGLRGVFLIATIRRHNLILNEVFLPPDDMHDRWTFDYDVCPRESTIDVTTLEADLRYMSSHGYVDGWIEIECELGELYRYILNGKDLCCMSGHIVWCDTDATEEN